MNCLFCLCVYGNKWQFIYASPNITINLFQIMCDSSSTLYLCVYMTTKHFFRFNNIVFKTIFFVISFILERLICIKGSLPPQFVYIIFPHYQFLIPEFFFLSIIFGEKQAFGIYMPSTYKSYTRQFITRGENEHKSCVITKMIVFQGDATHLRTYWVAKTRNAVSYLF